MEKYTEIPKEQIKILKELAVQKNIDPEKDVSFEEYLKSILHRQLYLSEIINESNSNDLKQNIFNFFQDTFKEVKQKKEPSEIINEIFNVSLQSYNDKEADILIPKRNKKIKEAIDLIKENGHHKEVFEFLVYTDHMAHLECLTETHLYRLTHDSYSFLPNQCLSKILYKQDESLKHFEFKCIDLKTKKEVYISFFGHVELDLLRSGR